MRHNLITIAAAILLAFPYAATAQTPAEVCMTTDQTWVPPIGLSQLDVVTLVGGGAAGAANAGVFGTGGVDAPGAGTAGTGWGAGGGAGIGAGGGGAGQVLTQNSVVVTGNLSAVIGQPGQTAAAAGTQTCLGTLCAAGGAIGGAVASFGATSGGQAGWGGVEGGGIGQTAPTQEMGSTPIYTSTTPQTLTIVNNSGAAATFPAITPPANVFVTSDNCSSKNIPAGGSCTFNVAAQPITLGDFNANLVVNSGRGNVTVPIHATGLPPPLVLVSPSPAPVNFPTQDTAPITVTLKNNGATNLTLGTMAMSGTNPTSFAMTPNTCSNGAVLAPGATCAFSASFNPSAIGSYAATMTLTLQSGGTFSLDFTGTATLLAMQVSPTSLDYGTVLVPGPSAKSVTVTNPNKWQVPFTAAASGGQFGTVTDTCSGKVPALGTCTVSASFSPSAAGAQSGSLTITY